MNSSLDISSSFLNSDQIMPVYFGFSDIEEYMDLMARLLNLFLIYIWYRSLSGGTLNLNISA